MAMNIAVQTANERKQKPDSKNLGFGNHFTDHMFILDYTEGRGWHDPRIIPYGPISLEPAAMVFHYAQEVFEGLKAYRAKDGRILLFRPEKNVRRLNLSNERLCIPQLEEEDVLESIAALVRFEQDWIPEGEGNSLYIRPFIIATDPHIGVRPSKTYQYIVILSPVGAYYPEGMSPVKIYAEDEYVRAVKGGIGFAKTGGNYAASIKSQMKAKELGYTQVLWLDGKERKYIDEVGTMNVFFVLGDEVITPELNGSILPGVTRDSCIELLKSWGYKVSERPLAIDEVMKAADEGKLAEAFGTGTAAVISPIGEMTYGDRNITIGGFKTGPISQRLYDEILAIQTGEKEDTHGWTTEVK